MLAKMAMTATCAQDTGERGSRYVGPSRAAPSRTRAPATSCRSNDLGRAQPPQRQLHPQEARTPQDGQHAEADQARSTDVKSLCRRPTAAAGIVSKPGQARQRLARRLVQVWLLCDAAKERLCRGRPNALLRVARARCSPHKGVMYLRSVPEAGKHEDRVVRVPSHLSRSERAFAASCGLALLIAGTVAVFLTDSDLGTAALLAAGLILVVLGVTGKLPSRISYGDKSVEWLQDLVETSLNSADSIETKNEVIVSFGPDRLPKPAQREVSSAVGVYIAYEQSVIAALNRVRPPDASASLESRRGGRDEIADALLSHDGKHLLIEIKYRSSNRLSSHEISPILSRFGLVNEKIGPANLLIVANVPPSASAAELMTRSSAVFTLWRDEEDDSALKAAIEQGLSKNPRS